MQGDRVRLVVLTGVTGCGKSLVGRALAAHLHWDFLEGDAFHGPTALSKMVRGEALTEDDRFPWLDRLAEEVRLRWTKGRNSVLACSALREVYRDILRSACPDLLFVHLHGDPERLVERLRQRTDHFSDERLLPSQCAAWEPCPDALALDAFLPVDDLVQRIAERLELSRKAIPAPASAPAPAG